MNLYFRLLWVLLRLAWIPKQSDLLQVSTLTLRVMPNDLDLNFHMNNGRYLTIMDLGRLHHIAITGLLRPILKKGWMPMLGSVKIHYLRSLNAFDQFRLTTQIIFWDEKWIYLEQKMYKKEELCATALIKGLFTGKQGKITSDELLGLLPNPPLPPPLPDSIKYWKIAEKMSKEN